MQRQMAKLCGGRCNHLILFKDAAGLKLVIVGSRQWAYHRICGWIELRSRHIVGEVLMNAAGKEIGNVESDLLCNLLVNANAPLHAEGRVKVVINVVKGWNGS